MSLQLNLLPFYNKDCNFSHAIIPCDYSDDSFDNILGLPALDVDNGFNSYCSRNSDFEEPHYGETLETPYGERLQWTHAKHLKPLLKGPEAAFINELDDYHRIALLWH